MTDCVNISVVWIALIVAIAPTITAVAALIVAVRAHK